MNILSINIDAVNARWGIFNDKYDCLEQGEFDIKVLNNTPLKTMEFISNESKLIIEKNKKIEMVSIQTPGTVDTNKGIIIDPPPMMMDWKKFPLVEIFSTECKIKTMLFNESKAAALNEIKFGKLQDSEYAVFINFYSCIEGALIFKGEIIDGISGAAGEFGRQIIGDRSWDKKASTFTLLNKIILMSGERKLKTNQIPEIVKENDYLEEEYDKWFYNVAEGIANIILSINPNKIILSGRITMSTEFEISNLIRHLYKFVDKDVFEKTVIDISNHGNNACLVGGAVLVNTKDIQL